MRVATGTVVAGKVVLDEETFSDGTGVYVVSRDLRDKPRLSPEELAELEAGLAEADHGDMISGEEFFKQFRRHG